MMDKEKTLKQYCHSVGKNLICKQKTKKQLLDGLFTELSENTESLSLEDPKIVAAQLQECVSEEEYQQALKRKKRLPFWIGLLVAIILSLTMAAYLHHLSTHEVDYVTDIIYEGDEYPDDSSIDWIPIE